MDSEDAIRRADQARMILDNPLFAEAMTALDESLRRQRLLVKPTDANGHAKLILAEQVKHQFEQYLRRAVEDGKLAEMRLTEPQQGPIARIFRR